MTTVTQAERSNHEITEITHTSRPERVDAVVIGGSQAGLAAGYWLARTGLDFVILDAHDRVGDAWRNRWDSLELFTPARISTLPGMPLPLPPNAFPTKDQVADYLERYAAEMALPVRTGVEARTVTRPGTGRWRVETSRSVLEADAVIIATGSYRDRVVPPFAADLDPSIRQLHAADYHNPSQFQPGDVLVVGASTSGAEIAVEAAREHATTLAGRDTGHMPIRPGRGVGRIVLPVMWFVLNRVLTVDTPMGRKAKRKVRSHGAPLDGSRGSALATAGVTRITERVTGTHDGKPTLADGRVLDVRNVVWCTGFHNDYAWIDGLGYGDDGYPAEQYGVAMNLEGLYFVGLTFQRSFASSLIGGVGRDARYVVDHLATHVRQTV
jgi:putative flavoprotein involved in K+ transport